MDLVPRLRKSRLWKSKADFFRPFRSAVAEAGENIVPLFDPHLHRAEPEGEDLKDLNDALVVLADLFPDVQPEVFREMLSSISQESRIEVVAEHLLTKRATWVRGRHRPPGSVSGTAKTRNPRVQSLADEELYRSDSYKRAVKQVFYQEFKNLSHSSIKAVLAEQNYSYTLARPILHQLANKSWRFSLSSFWPKRSPSTTAGEHPYIIWQPSGGEYQQAAPAVRRTESSRLDAELYDLFVAPVLEGRRQTQLAEDFAFASRVNEEEADSAQALFDCECCYSSVTFEQIATCDVGCHQLCFDCVRRTVTEALFGQGWARNVDLHWSTVRCFASTTNGCDGTIPVSVLRRALSSDTDKEDVWNEFQERVASEVLIKIRLPLQRCPFCSYVEVNETPRPQIRTWAAIRSHISTRTSSLVQLALLALLPLSLPFILPILLLMGLGYVLLHLIPGAAAVLEASWSRVYQRRRGLKFHCLNPTCHTTSCTRCLSSWRDPHTCFENEKTSLRTAIEASATAAVKRTCPKCLLSFVKSSGCNKLVCNCGYTMCYICRQEITHKEGYAHFCQHFRPHGGRCGECERCDLYGDEDEDVAIRNAAEAAERAWREKEKGREGGDERATQAMVEALVGRAKQRRWWEVWLDGIVDAVVA